MVKRSSLRLQAASRPQNSRDPGGWAAPGYIFQGHYEAHFLSALALMYAQTGDITLKNRAIYIVDELEKCQNAMGGKYLFASPQSDFNVYNILKITRHLFKWTGSLSYADFYERTIFNGILSSQNPSNGEKTYYQFMNVNSAKTYNSNTTGCFCCNGTGLESFSKFGDSV